MIELTFVTLGRGFKKAGSVLHDIGDSWDKDVLNPVIVVPQFGGGVMVLMFINIHLIISNGQTKGFPK